jgi:elongation factor 1 alpha-like protein
MYKDLLEPPSRPIQAPLRIPITNVFKGQTSLASGVAVAGRVVTGVVQVGERLAVLPGTESAVVRRELQVCLSQQSLMHI